MKDEAAITSRVCPYPQKWGGACKLPTRDGRIGMRVAMVESERNMNYQILLRKEPTNGYIATVLGWPGQEVIAPTREEALTQIRAAITEALATAEIVDLDLATPAIPSAYAETFGMFRDDPTFTEFVEEVSRYHQERNRPLAD